MTLLQNLYAPRSWWRDASPAPIQAMLTRAGATYSIGVLLRVTTFLMTSLPSPAPHCRLPADGGTYDPELASVRTVSDIFTVIDAENGCGDLIFSGHTLFFLLSVLICCTYSNIRYVGRLAKLALPLIVMPVFVYSTIVTRRHYTVDIVVAIYVTIGLWTIVERFVIIKTDKLLNNDGLFKSDDHTNSAAKAAVEEGAVDDAAIPTTHVTKSSDFALQMI
jgi:hypothetical protein